MSKYDIYGIGATMMDTEVAMSGLQVSDKGSHQILD